MGIFGYFRRRRERESAISGDPGDSLTAKLQGDGEVIGQPIQSAPQQGLPFELGTGEVVGLGGLVGAIGKAMQTGNFQVIQGQPEAIDLRGALGMREEILDAMRQHGIDPSGGQTNVNAADYQGLQEQIMQVLSQHGIDVGSAGAAGTEIKGDSEDES